MPERQILGGHLLLMLDVAVGAPLHRVSDETASALRSRATSGSQFQTCMDEGSSWLFYGHGYADEHRRSQRLEAFYLQPNPGRGGERLAVQMSLGIGVLTLWEPLPEITTFDQVLEWKREAGGDGAPKALRQAVKSWGLDWDRVGRITPLLVVQMDTDDLGAAVTAHAADLGALLTGNLEDERPELLAAYAAETNISGRRFERVYLRWTDALAVYDRTVSKALIGDDRTVSKALVASLRVARLVETGLLMRRLLREAAFETETLTRALKPWTFPWLSEPTVRAESLRQVLADAQTTTSVAPPVHSIEGETLLARTMDAFEVPRLREEVHHALAELDRRLEWRRLRWLAGAALLVFLLNTAISLVK